ncbi:MAG: PAS domain S-box protein, partial [bacterium]|nr:PAS domain S-box protein [bacterium]
MHERGVIREGSGRRERSGFGVETEEATVAAFMVSNLLTLAENRGAAADALLAGTNIQSESLAEPDTQVAWSAFVQIGRNACRIWSDSELVELGNQYVHLETAIPLLDLALAVHDPLEFYKWLTDSGRYRTILRMEERSEIIGRDRLRLEIEMPPGHESCPMYLLIRKGFFEEVSTLLGCGPADVRLETNAHGAVFEIRVPVLSAPWPRLRYWLRRVRGVFTSQERMIGAIDRLRRRNDAARRRIHVLDAKLVELDRSRERFDLLFRSAPTAMLISRARDDYAVLDVNDKFLASTGYDRESVTKWTQHQLGMWVKLEDRDAVFGKVLDGGGRIEGVEVCVEHADGHEIVALLSVEPVELSGESCMLWQAVDITLRKQHERELALYRERLEELVEERSEELKRSLESLQQFERLASVGTLAAGIAHQINNPVAAIRAASEFALMTGDDPEAVKGYREALETCVEQADRCGEITRNILRFSRGEASVRVPVDLRTIVLRSCDLVASYAHEGGATLHV